MKTLAIIGSTGSIGISSLKLFDKNRNKFKLVYITGFSNFKKLNLQIKKYKPVNYFIFNKKFLNKISSKNLLSFNEFIKYHHKKIDYVISGVSGYDTFDLNLKLLKISKNLLIANKEAIICGGNFFFNEAKKNNCNVLPIDSEHFCINYFLKNFNLKDDIEEIYLTASGGPFLKKKINFYSPISKTINHPTWKMGKKISVNSSTMANKVLELFEAKFLFKVNHQNINIIVENKSKIHSILKLKNNLLFFIGHQNDMKIPIANALSITTRIPLFLDKMSLNFTRVNQKKFPLVKLGYRLLKFKHSGMIIFTILNDRLVDMYLSKKIHYGEIITILISKFNSKKIVKYLNKCIKTKSDIKKIINFAQNIKL